MTVNYFIDTKTSAILLVVQHQGKKFRVSTGKIIKPSSCWDNDNKKVKSSFEGYNGINEELKSLKEHVDKIIREYKILNNHQLPTLDYIKGKLNPESVVVSDKSFNLMLDKYVERAKEDVKKSTYTGYKSFVDVVKEFQKVQNIHITFENINSDLISKFKKFVQKRRNCSPATVKKYLNNWKFCLNWGIKNEYLKSYNESLFDYKASKRQGHIVYLNEKEIEILEKYEATEKERIALDCFLFQCYSGLRFGDLQSLRPEHIRNGHIDKVTYKSDTRVYNPLSPKAIKLLEKYKSSHPLYCFPVPRQDKVNPELKEICRKAGFTEKIATIRYEGKKPIDEIFFKHELIGTHTGRRSFATNLIFTGCPFAVVSKLLGHSSIAVTERYFKHTPEVIAFLAKSYMK